MAESQEFSGNYKPVKFTADAIRGRLRESLAEGIYQDVESSFHVLRELVQNGADSIKDYRKEVDPDFEGEIRIKLSASSIEVFDTGKGMSREELHDIVKFGASKKDPDFHIGWRGIGFWANSTLASKVYLISKQKGSTYRRALMVDIEGWKREEAHLSLLELLNKYVYEDEPAAEDRDQHYTIVRLTHLTESGHYLVSNLADARTYLRKTIPLEFEEFNQKEKIENLIYHHVPHYETFRVFLNGDQLFKPGYEHLQDVFSDEIRHYIPPDAGSKSTKKKGGRVKGGQVKGGQVIGWYWAGLHTKRKEIEDPSVKGILFRVKGFAIGDQNLFRSLFKEDVPTPDWYYGEIYVLDSKVTPDSSRTHFEGTKEWIRFISVLSEPRGLINKLKRERRSFSKSDLAMQKIPQLIAEAKHLVAQKATASVEDFEKLQKKIETRIVQTTKPDLKRAGQTAVRQLASALASKKLPIPTVPIKVVSIMAVNRLLSAVIRILGRHITNKNLLRKIQQEIKAEFDDTLKG